VGWSVLDRQRTGAFEGMNAILTWEEGGQTVTWAGQVGPGRTLPLPGCMEPVSSAKSEREWAVTAVHRRLRGDRGKRSWKKSTLCACKTSIKKKVSRLWPISRIGNGVYLAGGGSPPPRPRGPGYRRVIALCGSGQPRQPGPARGLAARRGGPSHRTSTGKSQT
jgi:hypothetical protein